MASRYTDTEIWNEDWFCEMPGEYQLFAKYVFDKCDNAGVWKPNKFDFETKTKFKVSIDLLFKRMNAGGGCHERVLLLDNGRWFLTGYILFQWFNKKKSFDLVLSNRLHKSLYDILVENKISFLKVRGLKEVLERPMVMVMVMDKEEEKGGVGEKEEGILRPLEDRPVFYTIEHCLTVAMNDQRWVRANKTSDKELKEFNALLEKRGVYEKNPMDYKKHFANWKNSGKKEEQISTHDASPAVNFREEKARKLLGL